MNIREKKEARKLNKLYELPTFELQKAHSNITKWLKEQPSDLGGMSRLMLMCADDALKKELRRRESVRNENTF